MNQEHNTTAKTHRSRQVARPHVIVVCCVPCCRQTQRPQAQYTTPLPSQSGLSSQLRPVHSLLDDKGFPEPAVSDEGNTVVALQADPLPLLAQSLALFRPLVGAHCRPQGLAAAQVHLAPQGQNSSLQGRRSTWIVFQAAFPPVPHPPFG